MAVYYLRRSNVLPVNGRAIFDVRHTQTSYYIRTSLVVLPDPENMGKS